MIESLVAKEDLLLLPATAPGIFEYRGNWVEFADGMIGKDLGVSVNCHLPKLSFVAGLFTRHDWSGAIAITFNGRPCYATDLFSHATRREVIELLKSADPVDAHIEITSVGRNPASRSAEIVFHGLILPGPEVEHLPIARFFRSLVRVQHAAETFQEVQVNMMDRFVESQVQRGIAFVDLHEQGIRRYSFRVREALVFAQTGDRLLDIGAGFVYEEVLRDLILPLKIDYCTMDIDDRAVEHTKNLFQKLQLDPERVHIGENTSLPFEDGSFDMVFSSHCLEHSSNLKMTFGEIRRVLEPDGILFFSVPLEVDYSNEHLYCMTHEQWIQLTVDSGFDLLTYHLGKVYAGEVGWDLTIVARRRS